MTKGIREEDKQHNRTESLPRHAHNPICLHILLSISRAKANTTVPMSEQLSKSRCGMVNGLAWNTVLDDHHQKTNSLQEPLWSVSGCVVLSPSLHIDKLRCLDMTRRDTCQRRMEATIMSTFTPTLRLTRWGKNHPPYSHTNIVWLVELPVSILRLCRDFIWEFSYRHGHLVWVLRNSSKPITSVLLQTGRILWIRPETRTLLTQCSISTGIVVYNSLSAA
jgi:hypothetical protein